MKFILRGAVVLTMLSLVGCGASEKAVEKSPNVTVEDVEAEKGTNDVEVGDSEVSDSEVGDSGVSDVDNKEKIKEKHTIEETVILDEGGIKVTANDLKYTERSMSIDITVENNTKENINVLASTLSFPCNYVNGYMIPDGYVHVELPAGKKAKETVDMDLDQFQMYGIKEVSEIGVGFEVKNDDYDDVIDPVVGIIKTSGESYSYENESFAQSFKDSDMFKQSNISIDSCSEGALFDVAGVVCNFYTFLRNSDDEQVIMLEYENTSEQSVSYKINKVVLNGLSSEMGTEASGLILPGKKIIQQIELNDVIDKYYFSDLGIENVGKIEFEMEVLNSEYETIGTKKIGIVNDKCKVTLNKDGEEIYDNHDIRVIKKAIIPAKQDSIGYINALIIVENNSDKVIAAELDYDSLSINGFMVEEYANECMISEGGVGLLEVQMDEDSLKENGINSVEDIKDIEFVLNIETEDGDDIDQPTLKVTLNE